MAEARDLAFEVGPVAVGEHLVQAHLFGELGARLDRVDDGLRFAVADADDHVAADRDVTEGVLGRAELRPQRVRDRRHGESR